VLDRWCIGFFPLSERCFFSISVGFLLGLGAARLEVGADLLF